MPQQRNHHKYGTIREQVSTHHIDILGLSEVNLKWNRFSSYDRLSQRVSKWWETTHCTYGYNSHDLSTAKFQPGGTAVISINHLAHKVTPSRTQDPTGLGRWTSTLYQGKQNTKLRVIQMYRPCKPNPLSSNGVYQQHSRYFLSQGITSCPRETLLTDLFNFSMHCIQNDEQLIIMGDFNDNVIQPPISNFFETLNMHNLLHSLFEDVYHQAPNTFTRGKGSIDAIYATHSIQAIRGGYLPSHTFDSDHKTIWVDIQFRSIFGSKTLQQTPLQCRRLKNEDPRIVNKFNSAYHALLQQYHLPQALSQLISQVTSPLSLQHQQEYERIDKIRVHCLLTAEKKCRKLKTGQVEFSPTIQHHRNLIRFWKLLQKRKLGYRIDTKYLSRWERKLQIQNSFSIPLSEIQSNLKLAHSTYNTLKKAHSSLRDEWIAQLAAARAEAGNTDSTTELNNLRQKEKIRNAFRQIRWCLHHESTTPPITSVTEVANGSILHHSEKETVEQAILSANNKKYRQTNDTPPMTTLYPILGRYGTTEAARKILQGSFQPPQYLDIYTKKLLKALARPPHLRHVPEIDISYSSTEYKTGWAKMKEKTTSGLSKIHFGHHLACTKHNSNANFESQMCAIPYQTGYSPKRYQKSVNAMLLKKAGKTDVDSLRTIVLLEPDFNHMNKKLGRDVMFHAEKHNLIAPEQFGSRKGHSSIDQVLIKTLFYDILRIKRQDGYLCSNDAKGCYDRITHSIASIALQRVGLPQAPIVSMLSTLQQMQHHLRTGYGISDKTYGKTLQHGKPTQGSGQGNGASPTIWVMMSTPLLNMMRTEKLGAHFISPLTKEKIQFVGCSFVDDTDLVCTSFDSDDTLEDLHPQMQRAINTWEGGLRATGGALVPEKSWVYPIKYTWNDKGDPTLEKIENLEVAFTVKNAAQDLKSLTLTPPSDAKETLGVFLSPDGSNTKQVQYLKNKVLQWSDKIRTHHITPNNALLSIQTTILSTLKYPAPALSLSKKEWQEITSPLYNTGLQSSGICNKLPTAIRHGATNNLGLNLPCMYLTQGIYKLMKYMTHIHTKTILGQMLRLCEETSKLELGLPGNLYATPYKKAQFLVTSSWIKHLWSFVQAHKIILQNHSPPLTSSTNNDRFLMDIFLKTDLKKRELIQLNKCRKYLKLLTVGDIITGDGKRIIPSIKNGQRPTSFTSTMHWPNQEDPGPQAWATWRRSIKKYLEWDNKLLPALQPTHWTTTQHKRANWYYNRRLNKLLQRTNNEKWHYYVQMIRRGRRNRYPTYCYRGTLNTLPTQSTPATIIHRSAHIVQFTGTMPLSPPPPPQPAISNLTTYINSLHPNHQHALSDILHLDNIPHIINCIQTGNCAVVTDGSYYPSTSQTGASFIVGNEAMHRLIIGRCDVVGPKTSFSAYRAELAGLHGGLNFILALCKSYHITSGRITLSCDNDGALGKIANQQARLQQKHFDYITAIHNIISQLPLQITYTQVDGHKDQTTSIRDLTLLESMNILADDHAKIKAANTPSEQGYNTFEIPYEWSPLYLVNDEGGKIRIHSCMDKELYTYLTTRSSKSYWQRKMKIPPDLNTQINWNSLGIAFSKLSTNKRREVLKWHSGFCGTNLMLFHRKQSTTAACPGCNNAIETTEHIIKCPTQSATIEWDQSIQNLESWLEQHDSAPEVTHAIISGLRAWRSNTPQTQHRFSLPLLADAVAIQNRLGWKSFLHGFTAIQWAQSQELYLQFRNKRITGRRWVAALIRKLWETIWHLWRYRNSIVHEQTNEPLRKVNAMLNLTMMKELHYGLGNLPSKYEYLFKRKNIDVLKTSINQKKQWILTVWVARDTLTPEHPSRENRNNTIQSMLLAWKHRIQQYKNRTQST